MFEVLGTSWHCEVKCGQEAGGDASGIGKTARDVVNQDYEVRIVRYTVSS